MKGRNDWKGPLAQACADMNTGEIMDALGYTSTVAVTQLMQDEERQRRVPANRLASLYSKLDDAGKRILEKEIYQVG